MATRCSCVAVAAAAGEVETAGSAWSAKASRCSTQAVEDVDTEWAHWETAAGLGNCRTLKVSASARHHRGCAWLVWSNWA